MRASLLRTSTEHTHRMSTVPLGAYGVETLARIRRRPPTITTTVALAPPQAWPLPT